MKHNVYEASCAYVFMLNEDRWDTTYVCPLERASFSPVLRAPSQPKPTTNVTRAS